MVATTQKAADEWVSQKSENQECLLKVFPADYPINIADIGACDGLSSVRYYRLFNKCSIWAFEPIGENISEMEVNFQRYGIPRYNIIPLALSDREGICTFWQSHGQHGNVQDWNTGNKSSSLLKPTGHIQAHPWCKFRRRNVRTARLDDIWDGRIIDFAHIDVQGAELMVLNGGERSFRNTRAFWIEVANTELYQSQPMKVEIETYMKSKGYKCDLDTCRDNFGDMFFSKETV